MTSPAHPPADRKAPASGYDRSRALMPLLRVMMWLVRALLAQGVLPSKALLRRLEAAQPKRRSRHLRRARAACYRRAMRHALKGYRMGVEAYTPRAYAHHSYAMGLPEGTSFARFQELYARDCRLGRARVFGLSSAHEILHMLAGCKEGLGARLMRKGSSSPLALISHSSDQILPGDQVPP